LNLALQGGEEVSCGRKKKKRKPIVIYPILSYLASIQRGLRFSLKRSGVGSRSEGPK